VADDRANITNAPIFNGPVSGQIHTGSGDMHVTHPGAASKDELLAALRVFKAELDVARRQGLPGTTGDDVLAEVEAAEREVRKDAPQPERVVKRLDNAKELLVAGTGVTAAATTAVEAAHKLVPLLDAALHAVRGAVGL
jgi:hypothetical protein